MRPSQLNIVPLLCPSTCYVTIICFLSFYMLAHKHASLSYQVGGRDVRLGLLIVGAMYTRRHHHCRHHRHHRYHRHHHSMDSSSCTDEG